MKLIGKHQFYADYRSCGSTIKINCSGQNVTVYCYSNPGHLDDHEGTISVEYAGDNIIIQEVNWSRHSQYLNIEENRGGIARLLLLKIPQINDVAVDWPCNCGLCKEMQNQKWSIHTTIVTLNDQCHWGRTPEENSERNIIDWLDSLPFDFTIKD